MARPALDRPRLLVAAFAAAGLLAVGLVVASQLGARGGSKPSPSAAVAGADESRALLAGIPQRGAALGKPDAPVTLVEYADLQCPYCGVFARDTLPTLVREYVRPGRLRIVFRGLAFVGPDSETALRTVLAAGAQDRLWNVLDLLFANQGRENAGWLTDRLVREIGAAVPGLDVPRMLAERDSPAVAAARDRDESIAAAAGIDATPSFQLGRTGGSLERLAIASLDPAAFRSALDRLLAA